jgi:hypothetical protein
VKGYNITALILIMGYAFPVAIDNVPVATSHHRKLNGRATQGIHFEIGAFATPRFIDIPAAFLATHRAAAITPKLVFCDLGIIRGKEPGGLDLDE